MDNMLIKKVHSMMAYPNIQDSNFSSILMVVTLGNEEKTEAIIYIPKTIDQPFELTVKSEECSRAPLNSVEKTAYFRVHLEENNPFMIIYTANTPKEKPIVEKEELERILGCSII